MINHLKYAKARYPYWICLFATILGIVALLPFDFWVSLIIVIVCFFLAFIIPFLGSCFKSTFELKTLGKTKVSLLFGDLFKEECVVITTNNYFDISPTGEYISPESLIGSFVTEFLFE